MSDIGPTEVLDQVVEKRASKVARILREKNIMGHYQCDYCAHEGDDCVHLTFRLCEPVSEPKVFELHHVKVCLSCLFFFKSIAGVEVKHGTF